MKLTGIILIIITAAMAGNAMADTYTKRYGILKLTERLIDMTVSMIRCRAAPFEDIIRAAAEDKELSSLGAVSGAMDRLREGYSDLRDIWRESLDATRPSFMKEDEYNILAEYGRSVGTTDIQGQLICLDNLRNSLAPLIKEAYTERKEKTKLCRSMGMLIGLMAAVILI